VKESNQSVIKTENLTKFYGKTTGITNLNLEVNQGEIFGFLGPNGSGKTTTINLLLNLITPTQGRTFVFGMDSRRMGEKIRERVGFLPANPGFYENLKGIEYLRYFSGLRGKKCDDRINELAEFFFNVDLNRRIGTYSEGMKQIIGIIQAFMHSPDLYILDEPTDNLDPLMKRRFYDLVREEVGRGKTVFLSSHILDEVEKLCQRTAIIRKGKLAVVENIEKLRDMMTKTIEVTFRQEIDPEILKVEGVSSVEKKDDRYYLEIDKEISPIFSKLGQLPVESFDYHKMTLEEIFWQYFEK
jgi:ABC-2 type transport system ATP-binding protein